MCYFVIRIQAPYVPSKWKSLALIKVYVGSFWPYVLSTQTLKIRPVREITRGGRGAQGVEERNITSHNRVTRRVPVLQRGVETPFGASMLLALGRPLVSEADAMAGRPILVGGW